MEATNKHVVAGNGSAAGMWRRFSNRRSWSDLHELMGLLGAPLNLRPRYNAAPGQDFAMVRVAAATA